MPPGSGKKWARLKLPWCACQSIHRIMAPRLAARVASFVLALGMMGLLGLAAVDFQEYVRAVQRRDWRKRKTSMAMLDREYEQEAKAFEGPPVKPDAVKAALCRQEACWISNTHQRAARF